MRSMHKWTTVILAALTLTACGGADTGEAIVIASNPVEGSPGRWEVNLNFGANSTEGCREMPSGAVAKVNGEELAFDSRGGRQWSAGPYGGGAWLCSPVLISGRVHTSTDGLDRIRIFEGSRNILSVDIAHLTGERTVQWIEPADGVLRGGMRAVLEWSPATDTVFLEPAGGSVPGIGFQIDQGPSTTPVDWDGPYSWEGARLSFPISDWHHVSSESSSGWALLNVSRVVLAVGPVTGDYAHAPIVAELSWANVRPGVPYTYVP